ncbi:MAG: hypothetical protein H0W87_07800 [Actinobacteria bacterium]|nr:hypothetical protein [Actinomycetota bacterium]
MKTLIAVCAAALVLAAPAFAGWGATLDITGLIKKTTTLVRSKPQFEKAVLLEADGNPKSGKVTTAAAITRWRIVYQNQTTKGSKFASAFVKIVNGHPGKVVGVKEPFLEDRNISTVPKMTLAMAVTKLRNAGHKEGFGTVTLRYPLGPGFSEPLYIFSFGSGEYWTVGTKTGKVKPIS